VDKVSVLYTHFINTINQRTVVQTLLPISSFDLPKSEGAQADNKGADPMIGYMFEPSARSSSIRYCRIIFPTRSFR
jgi:F0F1-type ATP synthase gamma subunit